MSVCVLSPRRPQEVLIKSKEIRWNNSLLLLVMKQVKDFLTPELLVLSSLWDIPRREPRLVILKTALTLLELVGLNHVDANTVLVR